MGFELPALQLLSVHLYFQTFIHPHFVVYYTLLVYSINHKSKEGNMLDDLKYIHTKDASDALGIAEKQWQQIEKKYEFEKLDFKINDVVFAGMGGSALSALLSTSWPSYRVPFMLWRKYDAPEHIGRDTLFIASSYSGNTEETLSALQSGEKAGSHIVVISGGGKLIEIAKEKGYPYILLPKISQPRFGAFYSLKALVTILEKTGLISFKAGKMLSGVSGFLKSEIKNWTADNPIKNNPAKQLALEIAGTTLVIYGGPLMFPAAYKWKISFNENAKNIAWCNEIPEFSHNEFLGWTSHPVEKPYSIVDLRSTFEHPRVQKRFIVTEKLLSGKRPHPHVINAKGDNLLEQMLYCVVLGDFVSIYTALLNGLDPTPVDLIAKMKTALND
jgi:glucose/mannose-6-phosphate isomerase